MRQIANIAVLCGLLVASLTGRVAAREAMVGPVGVELLLPSNFCELNPTLAADAQFIARYRAHLAGSGIQLLGISAACSELPGWRDGVSLLEHAVIFSADARFISQATPVDPETMRRQICDQIHAQATQAVSRAMAKANSLPNTIARNIRMNSAAVVGVDDNDPNACYTAVVQNMRTQLGTEKMQLFIDTTIAIKGKILFATAFMPYLDMQGVANLLAEHRNFVASWRASNGM